MNILKIKNATLFCGECYDIIKNNNINNIDVVITDPPYGINICKNGHVGGSHCCKVTNYNKQNWDKKLDKKYIDLMLSISKNQIIFGGNYYANWLPPSSNWIVWDKDNGKTNFADCELAWTSFNLAVRKIKFKWQGMLQEDMKNKEKRYHPTQKPIFVMSWIIDSYIAKRNAR